MFQFTITPETAITVTTPIARYDILVGWLVIGALAALGLVVLFFITRAIARRLSGAKSAFGKIVLLVLVPKEAAEKGGGAEAKETLQEIQEHISAAENLFTVLGGLKAEKGFKPWFFGYAETFAFEIVANDGLISFYVAAPRQHLDFIKQQVHAQHPFAQIEQVPDYNMFDPQGVIKSAYLTFRRPSFFPIKTYKKIEGDPLESIAGTISKIPKEDGAAVQFIVRSARRDWRGLGLKIVKEMKKASP